MRCVVWCGQGPCASGAPYQTTRDLRGVGAIHVLNGSLPYSPSCSPAPSAVHSWQVTKACCGLTYLRSTSADQHALAAFGTSARRSKTASLSLKSKAIPTPVCTNTAFTPAHRQEQAEKRSRDLDSYTTQHFPQAETATGQLRCKPPCARDKTCRLTVRAEPGRAHATALADTTSTTTHYASRGDFRPLQWHPHLSSALRIATSHQRAHDVRCLNTST